MTNHFILSSVLFFGGRPTSLAWKRINAIEQFFRTCAVVKNIVPPLVGRWIVKLDLDATKKPQASQTLENDVFIILYKSFLKNKNKLFLQGSFDQRDEIPQSLRNIFSEKTLENLGLNATQRRVYVDDANKIFQNGELVGILNSKGKGVQYRKYGDGG